MCFDKYVVKMPQTCSNYLAHDAHLKILFQEK